MRVLSAGAVAIAALVSVVPASSASPAQSAPQEHCAVLVGKAAEPGGKSPVQGKACSTRSAADALASAESQAARAGSRQALGAAASTLLVEYYEHSGFGGHHYAVYGSAGPCDYSGYSLYPDTGWLSWGDTMSAVKGHNDCNWGKFVHQNGVTVRSYWLPVSNLGAVNDNVGYINVAHR
ncbi:hypothetical protein [Kribbella italica]|uniref:Peptidase inhibitor family I36 n=1 Tax=Kribbella italica TaxID=1540520 RepID=A0A7W9JAD8_9ACTN|nr:hypothetical protein [Kribbella italica]MBB5838310.1 hypothetical protein [Kribbella italica]